MVHHHNRFPRATLARYVRCAALGNLNEHDIEDEVSASQRMIGVEGHLCLCDGRDYYGDLRPIRPGHLQLLAEFGL